MARPPLPWRRWLLVGAVGLALAGVFTLYLDPHAVVDLGNRLWSCVG